MRIVNDDVELYANLTGEGECVVLLHGFPLSHRIWESSARALASRYQVLAPDLRGMGASHVGAGPYLMEQLAGDLAAMLDSLGVERATVVGHSLGGYVALAFARMYAERVARLGLVATSLSADSVQNANFRRTLSDRIEAAHSPAEALDALLPGLFAPQTLVSNAQLLTRVREIAMQNSAGGLAAMLRGMALRDEAFDIAGDLAMPVAVILGGEDSSLSCEEAQRSCAAFPNARLEVIEGVGHLPMLESPDAFEGALESLLAR